MVIITIVMLSYLFYLFTYYLYQWFVGRVSVREIIEIYIHTYIHRWCNLEIMT